MSKKPDYEKMWKELRKELPKKLAKLRKAEEAGGRFLSALAYQGSETLVEIEMDNLVRAQKQDSECTKEGKGDE